MPRTDYRLILALALSLTVHLLPFLSQISSLSPDQPKSQPITAELRPAPPPAAVPLLIDESEILRTQQSISKPVRPKIVHQGSPRLQNWQAEVKRQFQKLDEREDFYPAEAVAQGLEGEVLVLLLLNESGQVSAARVEESSGYPLLDQAALRNVRALHSLPADAPRETLLPVRFRLR